MDLVLRALLRLVILLVTEVLIQHRAKSQQGTDAQQQGTHH